jgi:hypothetical protein
MNAQTEMTHQQELELLAEWLGIEGEIKDGKFIQKILRYQDSYGNGYECREWNPSPAGNSDDFLNMVAGRVNWVWFNNAEFAHAVSTTDHQMTARAYYINYNNDKVAAMKHAAYQVCLMAAKEWKETTR